MEPSAPLSHRYRLPRRLMLLGSGLLLAPAGARAAGVAELDKLLAGRTPIAGGPLRLDVPSIAENGLVVPLSVEMDSPMTEADHVTAIHVFAEGNPVPLTATFRFTAESGKAAASTRIRLAQTQTVIAVAETSTGKLYEARGEVKVTIGGCGG